MAVLNELAGNAVETPPRKKWTRVEIAMLDTTGVLDGQHYELIDGELVNKMGKKRRHVRGTSETLDTLKALFGMKFVEQEAPIDVDPGDNFSNEPEPDVIVLRRPAGEIGDNPQPSDLALVVEIADTTLRHDRTTKARLYARAGIVEYWVVDVDGRRLFAFREPEGGHYRQELEFAEADRVYPLESPLNPVAVASLLP